MRMTKEMYESLQVKDLKGIAESRGMKSLSRLRKDDLVEKLLEMDREEDERVLREREEKAREAAEARRRGQEEARAKEAQQAAAAKEKASSQAGAAPAQAAPSDGSKNVGPSAKNPAAQPDSAAPAGSPRSQDGNARTAEERNTASSRGGRQTVVRKPRKKVEIAGASQGRGGSSYASPYIPVRRERPPQPSASDSALAQVPAPGAVGTSSSDAALSGASSSDAGAAADVGKAYSPSTPESPSSSPSTPGAAPAPSSATADRYARRGLSRPDQQIVHKNEINPELDSGEVAHGILEVMGDGFGFIRSNNYMPGENDVYVAPSQIRRFCLKTGDIVEGNIRIRNQNEKFSALLYVKSVNGMEPEETKKRFNFEDMTPIFPNDRIRLEKPGASIAMRVMDLMCPVGKGQRGMIVSPPKAGKTTLLKEVARSIKYNDPAIHLIILLIDERPEEVTDIREALEGPNVEVIHSTFDELPEHHKRVAEMTIERAKRLVEHREDVVILLDSITRLTRAYNLTEPSSGRTLSGGLDPVALHMPKRFFGAARNMREGGSLTILATALIETGSKMDDVVYEEFKGTGNMELILNRKLSERRIFPAVDLMKSGTRRDDLLLTPDEQECVSTIRKAFIGSRGEEATDSVLDLFGRTRTNGEFVNMVKKHMWSF